MTLTPTKKLVSLPESWLRREASWRRMLVTSPSSNKLRALFTVVRKGEATVPAVVLHGFFGTRRQLGDMFDGLEKQLNVTPARRAFRTKQSVIDGMRVQIEGRELWEVPLDGGWNRVRDSDADAPMHQIILIKHLSIMRQ
jgi:hypothetical protein